MYLFRWWLEPDSWGAGGHFSLLRLYLSLLVVLRRLHYTARQLSGSFILPKAWLRAPVGIIQGAK
jgi:hypothetical protein